MTQDHNTARVQCAPSTMEFNSYENDVYTLQNTLTIFQQLLPHQIWIRIWVGLPCKTATYRTLTKTGPKKKEL